MATTFPPLTTTDNPQTMAYNKSSLIGPTVTTSATPALAPPVNDGGTGGGISAIDKLVFDATVQVTRTDGVQMVVSFQFYFRHYEGMQDAIKNSDGFSVKKLRMPMIKTYSMRKRSGDENISGENNDVAQYTPDPSEVIVIFPSKLMEISYRVDEEMLVMESTVPLTPPPLPMMKNNNHNNNSTNTRSYHGYNPSRVMSKVMIRYKADEPGNISQQAWCSGAAQVATAFQRWYTFVRRRAVDDKEGEALATILRTQPGPSRSRIKKLLLAASSSSTTETTNNSNSTETKNENEKEDELTTEEVDTTEVPVDKSQSIDTDHDITTLDHASQPMPLETSYSYIPEIHAEPPPSSLVTTNEITFTKPVAVRPSEFFAPLIQTYGPSDYQVPSYYHHPLSMNIFQPVDDEVVSSNVNVGTSSSTVNYPSVTNNVAVTNQSVPSSTGGKFKLGKYQVTTDPAIHPGSVIENTPVSATNASYHSSSYHRPVTKSHHHRNHRSTTNSNYSNSNNNSNLTNPTTASKELRRIMELQNQLQVASASVMEKLASFDGSSSVSNTYPQNTVENLRTSQPTAPTHTHPYTSYHSNPLINNLTFIPQTFAETETVSSSTTGYYSETSPVSSTSVPVNTRNATENSVFSSYFPYFNNVPGNSMMVSTYHTTNGTAYVPSHPQYITYATGPNGTPVAVLLSPPQMMQMGTPSTTNNSFSNPTVYTGSPGYATTNYNHPSYVSTVQAQPTVDGSGWGVSPPSGMMMTTPSNPSVSGYSAPVPYYSMYSPPNPNPAE